MAFEYHPDLLAPYQRLDQGSSIQAECMYFLPLAFTLSSSHLPISFRRLDWWEQ